MTRFYQQQLYNRIIPYNKPLGNQKLLQLSNKMIDNYIQFEYAPSHLIYEHQNSNKIHLGDVASALDIDFICSSNIRTVVTAAVGMDQVNYDETINHVVYAVLDSKNENLIQFFQQFYQLVENSILKGSILVHCAAGISRSATLVLSYLMKKNTWTFKDAISFVRSKRPNVLPNLGFQRQLKQYEKILLKQQNRRVKSKTSQSQKHNKAHKVDILPQIGLIGETVSRNKILQAYRVHKQDEGKLAHLKFKSGILSDHLSKPSRLQKANGNKIMGYSKQFTDTKSVNLQGKRQENSSKKHIPNVYQNGIFNANILPGKFNSIISQKMQKMKKSSMQFHHFGINRQNVVTRQKQNYLGLNIGYNLSGVHKKQASSDFVNRNIFQRQRKSYRKQGLLMIDNTKIIIPNIQTQKQERTYKNRNWLKLAPNT